MSCDHPLEKRKWLSSFQGGMSFFLGCHLTDLIYTLQGTPEEVYSHSYETTVKTEIHDAIYEEHEFSDKVYKALCKDEGHILEDLYQTFIGDLDANLFSKEGRKRFVEDYCEEYHQDIMSEDTGMGMS